MLKIVRTVEPTEEPVTIDEVKLHLRVDGSEEDAHIMNLITAAREYAEEVTWRAFCTQTWRMYLDCWPRSNQVGIPRAPLQSVSAFSYVDENGDETTISSSTYIVSGYGHEKGALTLKRDFSWPNVTLQEVDGLRIEFVSGYGDPSDVPQRVKQALLLLIGHWYENREDIVVSPGVVSSQVPMAAQALFNSLRAW